MAIGTIAAVAGVALQAYGMFGAKGERDDAAALQRLAAQEDLEQARLMRLRADIENVRRAKEVARQSLITRGQIIAGAAVGGVTESSGAVAARRDPISRGRGEIAALNRAQNIEDQIFESQTRQAQLGVRFSQAQNRAEDFRAIGQVGATVFSAAGGFGRLFEDIKGFVNA